MLEQKEPLLTVCIVDTKITCMTLIAPLSERKLCTFNAPFVGM